MFRVVSDGRQTNKAVQVIESTFEYCNSLDVPSFRRFALADGFRYTDRRTGGVNFGTVDASGLPALLATAWEVGSGKPHFSIPDVVAIRGDLTALVVLVISYEDGNRTEMLHLQQLDHASMGRRIVQFDIEDVEAAIAELDRFHAEMATNTESS